MGGGGIDGLEAEPQYAKGKTSVWWDIENCQVPRSCDPHAIAQNVSSALAEFNYSGPVSISAYGDTTRIPFSVQQALSSTGIALNHVPAGVKDARDMKILVDMLFWAVDNPAPANYLLISGDPDFSNALHQLRMRRYNVLLAQPQKASAPLVAAANMVWLWTSLVAGGPPLTKVESQQLSNYAEVSYSSDPFQFPDSNAIPQKQPSAIPSETSHFGRRKFPDGGRDNDPKQMGKTISRNMVHSVLRNKDRMNANYEHVAYNLQGSPPGPVTVGNRDLPWSCTNGQGNYQTHYPLPSTPNNFPLQPAFPSANVYPQQANIYPSRNLPFSTPQMMPPRPDGLSSTQVPLSISNLKISGGPSSVPNPYNFYQQNGGMKMSSCPQANVYTPQVNVYPHCNPPFGTSLMMPPRPDGPSSTQGPPNTSNLNIFDGPSGVPNICNFHQQNGAMKISAFTPANANPPQANVSPPCNPPFGTSPMMLPRPDGSRSTHGLQDTSNLNISGGPSKVPHPPKFHQQKSTPAKNKPSIYDDKKNEFPTVPESQSSTSSAPSSPDIPTNGTLQTPGSPKPSEYIQGLVRVIILTLDTLKNEKIMPTEANIVDCIQHGDPKHGNTDVRKGLECAVEQQMIVQQNIGTVQFYVGKNEELWKCIDPLGGDAKDYPKATWTDVKNFLTSSTGRSAILASQCRYEAGTIIKRLCLKQLALGQYKHSRESVISFIWPMFSRYSLQRCLGNSWACQTFQVQSRFALDTQRTK